MNSLFCIRDAGGVRRYKTYLSREQAEAMIERELDLSPGCRAPLDVVEFVEATPVVRAADELLHACEMMWAASNGGYPKAFMAIQTAVAHATGDRP